MRIIKKLSLILVLSVVFFVGAKNVSAQACYPTRVINQWECIGTSVDLCNYGLSDVCDGVCPCKYNTTRCSVDARVESCNQATCQTNDIIYDCSNGDSVMGDCSIYNPHIRECWVGDPEPTPIPTPDPTCDIGWCDQCWYLCPNDLPDRYYNFQGYVRDSNGNGVRRQVNYKAYDGGAWKSTWSSSSDGKYTLKGRAKGMNREFNIWVGNSEYQQTPYDSGALDPRAVVSGSKCDSSPDDPFYDGCILGDYDHTYPDSNDKGFDFEITTPSPRCYQGGGDATMNTGQTRWFGTKITDEDNNLTKGEMWFRKDFVAPWENLWSQNISGGNHNQQNIRFDCTTGRVGWINVICNAYDGANNKCTGNPDEPMKDGWDDCYGNAAWPDSYIFKCEERPTCSVTTLNQTIASGSSKWISATSTKSDRIGLRYRQSSPSIGSWQWASSAYDATGNNPSISRLFTCPAGLTSTRQYQIACNAWNDPSGTKCTGNPNGAPGWYDCGPNDWRTITCNPVGTTLSCFQTGCDAVNTVCQAGLACQGNRCVLASNPGSGTCEATCDLGCDPNDLLPNHGCIAGLYCNPSVNKCRLTSNQSSATCTPADPCAGAQIPTAPGTVAVAGEISNRKDLTSSPNVGLSWAPATVAGTTTIISYQVKIVPRGQSYYYSDSSKYQILTVPASANPSVNYIPQASVTNQVNIYVRALSNCGIYGHWSSVNQVNYVARVSGNFYEDIDPTISGFTDIACAGTGVTQSISLDGSSIAVESGQSDGAYGNLGNSYSIANVPYAPASWGTAGKFDLTLNLTDPAITCICPNNAGTCKYTDAYSPSTKHMYLSSVNLTNDPWWQTSGGNVYGRDNIESSITTECDSSPDCSAYIITENADGDTDSAGIPITEDNSIDSHDGHNSDRSTSSTNVVNANYDNLVVEDYDYFANEIDFSAIAGNIGSSTLRRLSDLPTNGVVADDDGTKVYRRNGNLTIQLDDTETISSGEKIVIFVTGDLDIEENDSGDQVFEVEEGGYIGFIVGDDIEIDPNVGNELVALAANPDADDSNLDGVYVATDEFRIDGYSDNDEKDKKFVGEGTFVGWGGFELSRDYANDSAAIDRALNNENPIVAFNFRPDLNKNTPNILKRPSLVWQEVN